MNKNVWTWPLIALGALALAACDKPSSPAKPGTTADKHAGHDHAAHADKAGSGRKHDPPIKKSAVPKGHWYCDMGTVHYSSPTKGNGKCPTCKMVLKQNK